MYKSRDMCKHQYIHVCMCMCEFWFSHTWMLFIWTYSYIYLHLHVHVSCWLDTNTYAQTCTGDMLCAPWTQKINNAARQHVFVCVCVHVLNCTWLDNDMCEKGCKINVLLRQTCMYVELKVWMHVKTRACAHEYVDTCFYIKYIRIYTTTSTYIHRHVLICVYLHNCICLRMSRTHMYKCMLLGQWLNSNVCVCNYMDTCSSCRHT